MGAITIKQRAFAAVTILALLGLLAPACSTPTPEVTKPDCADAGLDRCQAA